MKIIRAAHLGMCFGVRDAIALAESESAAADLTVLGELVHNDAVLARLAQRGVRIETNLEKVQTSTVMITAHGTSTLRRNAARERGLNVLEATCPLVHFVHETLQQLVQDGFYPVIIGKKDHVEVRGLTEDLVEGSVVSTEEDLLGLPEHSRFGVVAQTTQPVQRVLYLVRQIQALFPQAQVRFVDTVCRPTKQRQESALALAKQSDVVVVIGGAHSNNTRELVNTCRLHCSKVFHVRSAGDLRAEWFAKAYTVGITAGTSTPDSTIAEVEEAISALGARKESPCTP